MPNITRGGRMLGLMAYLVGPGREGNEVHIEPHLVAGDAAIMAWHDDAVLDKAAAMQIGRELDHPRVAFGTEVTLPVKRNDGTPQRDERTGRPLRKPAHVWHCSLSLPPSEGPLSDEQWAAINEEFVARMGFADPASDTPPCRWVAIRHGESRAGNDHVHLVVGLVREDGTPAKTWNDRPRAQQVAGELERKYGLQVLASREAGDGVRGEKPAERERAQRAPELAKDELARTVRACAAAAGDEAEFVRRVRAAGVLVRPRYAVGHDDVVVGYSAAHKPPRPRRLADGSREKRQAPLWYGGGHLARDLTLPRLRAEWPDTPAHTAAAIAEWRAAKRHQPVVAKGRETATTFDPEMWARYTTEVTALREQLRSVPIDDRALWAQVAHDTAGAFAAWSHRVETTPGPLADTARVLARAAQLRAHQVQPRKAGLPSVKGAALLLASVAAGGSGTVAQTVLLRQLANTIKALHDAQRAAGDARRADEIRDVVLQRLSDVYDRLPSEPALTTAGASDAQAADAARLAQQGQLPARPAGSPVPTPIQPQPTRPNERPGVQRPDKTEIDR
jgi:hypothetical protein